MNKKGLQNFGNTCYINSSLQCLMNSIHFNVFLDTTKTTLNLKTVFNGDLKKLLKQLSKRLPSYFKVNQQNDVHEFLMYLIDIMYEEQKKSFQINGLTGTVSAYKKMQHKCNKEWFKAYSPIMDTLYYQIVRQTECSLCDNTNLNIENNFILEVDIEKDNDSLVNSIDRYFAKHYVTDWTCDKCHKNSNKNEIIQKLWMMPKLLIVCVKRFKYMNGEMSKLKYSMDIPERLNMEHHCLQKDISYEYTLSGVINHLGDTYYGHYNADLMVNGDIIKIDDDSIIKYKSLNDQNCYILFYEYSPR
ncbi:hypothetical protein QKU58_gp033 [Pyramimonas orientalis virus]|uniref:ubiquitinyl hydrolase 1 n=1 Tax=Pyramimonas orientalis virus 01B TaxID=3134525 RepID=A0A7M3UNM9_9VIRU|nr:hypothetical protein QKU58_gp033 [Pyramimonas orientalis virus]QOI90298.1 hypothetical protein HWQ62_00161 [Pyramimonas orientalis virus]